MRTSFLIPLFVMFLVISCKDDSVKRYEQVVDSSDSIVISSRDYPDSVIISTIPGIDTMKENLKRHIRPCGTQKFFAEKFISFYEQGKPIGVMMISAGEYGFVNFRSKNLNLTFPVTPGIRTSLDMLALNNSNP